MSIFRQKNFRLTNLNSTMGNAIPSRTIVKQWVIEFNRVHSTANFTKVVQNDDSNRMSYVNYRKIEESVGIITKKSSRQKRCSRNMIAMLRDIVTRVWVQNYSSKFESKKYYIKQVENPLKKSGPLYWNLPNISHISLWLYGVLYQQFQ